MSPKTCAFREFGGWSIDAHHAHHLSDKVVYRGDGECRSASSLNIVIDAFAGNGIRGTNFFLQLGKGDGGTATNERGYLPWGIEVGEDGSINIADLGIPINTSPVGIEVGEDGSINIADWNTYRIVTIEIIHKIFKLYVALKISRFRDSNN